MKLSKRIEALEQSEQFKPKSPNCIEWALILKAGDHENSIHSDCVPGLNYNAGGNCVTYLYEGDEPDPAIIESIEKRMVSWGRFIRSEPTPPDRPEGLAPVD